MKENTISRLLGGAAIYVLMKSGAHAIGRFMDAPGLELVVDCAAPLTSLGYVAGTVGNLSEKNNLINSLAVGGLACLAGYDIANSIVNSECYVGAVNFLGNGIRRLGELNNTKNPSLIVSMATGLTGFLVNSYMNDKKNPVAKKS